MEEHRDTPGSRRTPFLIAFVIAVAFTSYAQNRDFTQKEVRALPQVCLAQRFVNMWLRDPVVPKRERDALAARLGPGYNHYHHFCAALIFTRRGSAASQEMRRKSNYDAAIKNFAYVKRRANDGFALMPEVCLRKGQVHQLRNQHTQAVREFIEAIGLKPDYTPAYASLIDSYLALGDTVSARETLAAGLERVPDSKILAAKKLELDAAEDTSR